MAISSDDYPCLLKHALENIPEEEMRNMAGNAFHLVSYGQFPIVLLERVAGEAIRGDVIIEPCRLQRKNV